MTDRALGCDVSFYQDSDYTPQKIDFQKMRNNGMDFVIMRTGQNTWVDEDFQDYLRDSAKVDGLLRGSYWFYDARDYIKNQTDLYWSQIKDAGLDIPPVMDFEIGGLQYIPADRFNRTFFLSLVKQFLDRMDQHTGKPTIFYTNGKWLKFLAPHPDWLTAHPLWVAYPGPEAGIDLYGWPNDWRIWQYSWTGDGEKYGVESKGLDMNYYNGTRQDMLDWLGQETPEPEPTLEERVADLERRVAILESKAIASLF